MDIRIKTGLLVAAACFFLACPMAVFGYWTDQPADVVIGQPNMLTNTANRGGSAAANTLYNPIGVYSDGTRLFIADHVNNRVLIYNSIPTTNNASADVVVGQANMSGSSANQGGVTAANTLYLPMGVYSDGTRLFIADNFNSRVLIYNSIPTVNNASADVVVGQSTMSGSSSNQGGVVGANTLFQPEGVYSDGTKLYISDGGNMRVLIYNSIPTVNNASADVVVGQSTMSGSSPNQGGVVGANTLSGPYGVYSDGTRLFITDGSNNRVLIYNSIPTVNNALADVVVGQSTMSSGAANQCVCTTITANGFFFPRAVYSDGPKLYISDCQNSRVLIYNSIPAVNNAPADMVIGQPNMLTGTANQGGGVGASTLFYPWGVYSDGTRLYVEDGANNRVLIYNNYTPTITPIPTVTATPIPVSVPCDPGTSYIYPSPVKGDEATIAYCLSAPGYVKIRVYNEVAELVETVGEVKPAGSQASLIDTSKFATGVYLYMINIDYGSLGSSKIGPKKFIMLR